LLAAIDRQARMPVVRIGEALVALKMISEDQLTAALEMQKADRSTPLGELLVRSGHVTREHLQLALARKMGYPVVDATAFPVEMEAVRRLPFSVAAAWACCRCCCAAPSSSSRWPTRRAEARSRSSNSSPR
jgi:hypothetical protein